MFAFSAYFKHDTYHGPSKHFRVPLTQNFDAKPLRFTDSQQHRLSRSRKKTKPTFRRKSTSVGGIEHNNGDVSIFISC